jgi:hypothetical protein
MVKNPSVLKKLEDDLIRSEGRLPFNKSIDIFASMWDEAVRLGAIPSKDPMDGIEVDVRIAKAINSCSRKSSQR